jgi:hypothetical protein
MHLLSVAQATGIGCIQATADERGIHEFFISFCSASSRGACAKSSHRRRKFEGLLAERRMRFNKGAGETKISISIPSHLDTA